MACRSHVSNTVAAFCLAFRNNQKRRYRLSRLSGSSMGPRSVERPVTVAGGSSRRDGGALGNDMDRTRNGRGDDRRIFSESSFQGQYRHRLASTSPHVDTMVQTSFGELVSQLLGWLYFLCWTISFYPQVLRVEPLLMAGNSELPKKVRQGT